MTVTTGEQVANFAKAGNLGFNSGNKFGYIHGYSVRLRRLVLCVKDRLLFNDFWGMIEG